VECNAVREIDIDHEWVDGFLAKDERQWLPYRGSDFSEINHAGRHALQLEITEFDFENSRRAARWLARRRPARAGFRST
jgi:hypothetical protein